MVNLIKGNWYLIDIDGGGICLLQYNDDEFCTGWWNGSYAEDSWSFTKGSEIHELATECPEELFKTMGIQN